MKALLQRVSQSSVLVDNKIISSIDAGLLIFLGIESNDDSQKVKKMAKKIANLRIFQDENDKMNLSIIDIEGEAIVVSQFTLMADTKKGNRPSFIKAAPPEIAKPIVEEFCKSFDDYGIKVNKGKFGAHMMVQLINDGPVTIWLDM